MSTTNSYGYAVGDTCRCSDTKCRIAMLPVDVRIERRNAVTGEITTPTVSVEILMGIACGTRYGRAF